MLEGIERRYREGWKQARMIASVWSKNANELEFPWEKKEREYSDNQRKKDMQAAVEAARRLIPDLKTE